MILHETIGRFCALTGEKEVKDLESGMDFRLPRYRREVFLRFYEFHLKYRAHPGCVYLLMPYLVGHFNWSEDERLWFAFLNGNTQNPVTSMLIFDRFPDFARLDIPRLAAWFQMNYRQLEFDTDRRHHKSHFIPAVQRYKDLCVMSQGSFFRD